MELHHPIMSNLWYLGIRTKRKEKEKEYVVEPSHKKPTREYYNRPGLRRKMIRESASSSTYYKMSENDGKHRKRYIDHPKDISKTTCLIHGPIYSSEECKILGDFGNKHAKEKPTKYLRQETATRKKL